MTLFTIFFLSSSLSHAEICNTTPTQCYEMEQRNRTEAIRLKQEREEAIYRQEQLQLQQAQLREMQEQRAVMEEELEKMNASQARMEEMKIKEMEKAKRIENKKK